MKSTTIFKYELGTTDFQTISLPKGAVILTIQAQRDIPCMWAMVDPYAETETRTFETFGTGHSIYEAMGTSRIYVGTYQIRGGSFVFHVFERLN